MNSAQVIPGGGVVGMGGGGCCSSAGCACGWLPCVGIVWAIYRGVDDVSPRTKRRSLVVCVEQQVRSSKRKEELLFTVYRERAGVS